MLKEQYTGEKGTRAEQGSASHLLAHGLLAAATSYATGQSPETITATTLSTMGAEALAPKLSQYLYGTEKVADLTTEQKQTISNVLGTAGLVTGVVTAQATGADSISSVSAGQQAQDSVQNAVENNYQSVSTLIKFNDKLSKCSKNDKACIAEAINYLRKRDTELDQAFDTCVKKQDTKCQHSHLLAILESDQSNELKTTKKLMQEYKISTQVFPFLNDKNDPENRDTGLSRLAAAKVNDVRKGHNIGCVSGTTTSCISPIKELPLNHKVFNAINDATIGQIKIAFGIERASVTEREKAVANLISLGVMRAPAGIASLSDDAILAIEKKYGSKFASSIKEYTVFSPSSKNPLAKDALNRNTERLIVDQGANPTCGHNSCKMVLDTLGKEVNIEKLISIIPPKAEGIRSFDVQRLLISNNVDSYYFTGRTLDNLARYTQNGIPVIVRIVDPNSPKNFSHFVVVDGITIRNGQKVVAIRDPHGKAYFSPVNSFKKAFTGEVIVPKEFK